MVTTTQKTIEQMTQEMTNLAAHIKTFEYEGNYVKIYFDPNVGDTEQIQSLFDTVGISEVIHKHTDMTGNKISGYSFILAYENSGQKKSINELEHKFIRMSALNKLFNYGGFQLSKEEQKYFDLKKARIAAVKAAGNVK